MNTRTSFTQVVIITALFALPPLAPQLAWAQRATCSDNTDCAPIEYCATDPGNCGAEGVCTTRPDVCTAEVAPVCGCNGVTYNNACEAAAAGVNVDQPGACLRVGFQPDAQTVLVGQQLSVEIIIVGLDADSLAEIVGAFDLDVEYDATILMPTEVAFGPSLMNGSGASLQSSDLSTPGLIDLAEVSLLPDAELALSQPGTVLLATLSFDALAAGTSPLSLVFDQLNDLKGREALMLLPALENGSGCGSHPEHSSPRYN